MSYSKMAGLAGVVFVALVAGFNVVIGSSSPPANDASAAEIASYYTANGHVPVVLSIVAPFVWVSLLVFGSGVFARVRVHDNSKDAAWSYVGLLGILMQNGFFAIVVATEVALGVGAATLSSDAGLTETIWRFQRAMFTLNGTSLAIALTGLSVASLRAGFIPRWHAYVGFLGAGLFLISAAATMPIVEGEPIVFAGLAGFLLWLVWVLAMSVRLIREPDATPSATASATSA